MSKLSEIRWAFDIAKWKPSGAEWARALSSIQKEEQERIGRFVFKRDAKASLAGQLMLRKLARETLQLSNDEIKLERTSKGKPYVSNVPNFPYKFNVSHQGSYTIVAASQSQLVGVDVMRIDWERFEDESKVEAFFHTMRKQFTVNEWNNIKSGELRKQLANFYRHWCLKESYVKAIGVGITINLQSIDFTVCDDDLTSVVTSTKLRVNGALQNDWRFEEQLLDDKHCACVALNPSPHGLKSYDRFHLLPLDELLSMASPLVTVDHQTLADFEAKEEEPLILRQ